MRSCVAFGLGFVVVFASSNVAFADDDVVEPPPEEEAAQPAQPAQAAQPAPRREELQKRNEDVQTQLVGPGFKAFIEGRFDEAADHFAKVESPNDPTEAKTEIAVELRRIASYFVLQGIVLVSAVTHPKIAAMRVGPAGELEARTRTQQAYDAAVPPYDRAVDELVNGDVESAERILRELETSARDRIELGVTRVLHAVARTWLERHIVPIANAKNHANGIIPKNQRGDWYGWEITAIDSLLVSGMVTVTALSANISTGVLQGVSVGAVVLMLAAPSWVHLGNGRSKAAVLSVASRSLFPITGALVGAAVTLPIWYALGSNSSQYLPLAGAAVGAGVGLIGAMIFDSVMLSYKPKELPTAHSPTSSLRPFAIPIANGAMAGVGGTL